MCLSCEVEGVQTLKFNRILTFQIKGVKCYIKVMQFKIAPLPLWETKLIKVLNKLNGSSKCNVKSSYNSIKHHCLPSPPNFRPHPSQALPSPLTQS